MVDDLPELGAEYCSPACPATNGVAHLLADLAEHVRPLPAGEIAAMSWQLTADPAGQECRLRATVTRRAVGHGRALEVRQTVRYETTDGATLGDGSLTWRGDVLSATAADAVRRSDLCGTEWGAAMRSRLEHDTGFADATRTFDGAIELVAEERTFQFRVYQGAVLDAGRKTPHGPTFSVVGSDLAWAGLITADRNDFTSRASTGQFGSRGSSFEYLRMFKALVLIAGHAREQGKEQRDALRALPRD